MNTYQFGDAKATLASQCFHLAGKISQNVQEELAQKFVQTHDRQIHGPQRMYCDDSGDPICVTKSHQLLDGFK